MPRVSSSAEHSLFLFLKRDRGLLTLNMKRKHHLLKIQIDELRQVAKLILHYHIATGGTMEDLGDLDVIIQNGINHFNRHAVEEELKRLNINE